MLKSIAARLLNRASYKSFTKGTKDPKQSYRELEDEILGLLKQGKFWREKMGAFTSLSEFPITDYEYYRSTIKASADEKTSPFTGEEIHFWCTSSGTSAEPKLFPISETYRKQLLRISSAYTYFLARKLGPNMSYPLIFFPATASGNFSKAGIEIGFISRFMFMKQPKMFRKGYAIPEEVFLSDELLKKWGPLYALSTDICAIMGTVPSLISTFCEQIENRKEELVGILTNKLPWPEGLPVRKISPERLETIKNAFSKSPFVMKELWPHMDVIVTWKGSTAGLQLPQVEKYNQGRIDYCDGFYSATEGWITVSTFENEEVGCPMHMQSTYVEFIEEGFDIVSAHLKKPWEIEIGKKYEIFLSQAMGFVRYRLYDVVLCKGFRGQAPVLEFVYKSGNMVSLGQARFSEIHLLEAIKTSGLHHNYEWTIAPANDGSGMIFHTTTLTDDLEEKVKKMDAALANLNSEIREDYQMNLLKPMKVQVLPFDHKFWVAGRHGQGKLRVLTKTPIL